MQEKLSSNCFICPFLPEHRRYAQRNENQVLAGAEELKSQVPDGLKLVLENDTELYCSDGPTIYEHLILGAQIDCPARIISAKLKLIGEHDTERKSDLNQQ